MTHVACESKLCSVTRSSLHPCPGNLVAIGRAVVYYAWTAQAFSAGIKCRHCMSKIVVLCYYRKQQQSKYVGYTVAIGNVQNTFTNLSLWYTKSESSYCFF